MRKERGPAADVLVYLDAVEYVLAFWAARGWIVRAKDMHTIEFTCRRGHFDRVPKSTHKES